MRRIPQTLAFLVILAGCMAAFYGCATPPPQERMPSTMVPISEFKTVAGKWEGLVTAKRQKDWLQIVIDENGNFEAVSRRDFAGTFKSKGAFQLIEGRLKTESERGSGTYTLFEDEGKRILRLEAITDRGIRHSGTLTPAKERSQK